MSTTAQHMIILIAGPYRSGTGDDPQKMADNLRRLEQASWPIFQAGHIPMIGEWVALPIWNTAGGQTVGDALYDEILHPTAGRLIERCDAATRCCGFPATPKAQITTCGWQTRAASRCIGK